MVWVTNSTPQPIQVRITGHDTGDIFYTIPSSQETFERNHWNRAVPQTLFFRQTENDPAEEFPVDIYDHVTFNVNVDGNVTRTVEPGFEYAVILDAGSSGTRLSAYKWKHEDVTKRSIPSIQLAFTEKKKGGLAKLEDPNADNVREYIQGLFQYAYDKFRELHVPIDSVPLFFYGTAGLRDAQQNDGAGANTLKECMEAYIQNPFPNDQDGKKFKSVEYKVISGEEEAIFGWIAANQSLGIFTKNGIRFSDTVGYVEMGGASAQIAFRPYRDELNPDDLHEGEVTKLKLGDLEYDLFLKTYDLGRDKAFEKYSDVLIERSGGGEGPIVDGNSPFGHSWSHGGRTIQGSGQFDADTFRKTVLEVLIRLTKELPGDFTRNAPRLLSDKLANSLRLKSRRFVGGANFWYSTRQVFGLERRANGELGPKASLFTLDDYLKEVEATTKLTLDVLQMRREIRDPGFWREAWFTAEWVKTVLCDGLGFDLSGASVKKEDELRFRPYDGPKGAELSWTLGKAVLIATGGEYHANQGKFVFIERETTKQIEELRKLVGSTKEEMRMFRYMAKSINDRVLKGEGIVDARTKWDALLLKAGRKRAEVVQFRQRKLRLKQVLDEAAVQSDDEELESPLANWGEPVTSYRLELIYKGCNTVENICVYLIPDAQPIAIIYPNQRQLGRANGPFPGMLLPALCLNQEVKETIVNQCRGVAGLQDAELLEDGRTILIDQNMTKSEIARNLGPDGSLRARLQAQVPGAEALFH